MSILNGESYEHTWDLCIDAGWKNESRKTQNGNWHGLRGIWNLCNRGISHVVLNLDNKYGKGDILNLHSLHGDNGLSNVISWNGKILHSSLNLLDHVKGLLRVRLVWHAIFSTNQ